jgi:hypothetical protein
MSMAAMAAVERSFAQSKSANALKRVYPWGSPGLVGPKAVEVE